MVLTFGSFLVTKNAAHGVLLLLRRCARQVGGQKREHGRGLEVTEVTRGHRGHERSRDLECMTDEEDPRSEHVLEDPVR